MRASEHHRLDYCREEVCSRCPGSLWGAKSICRVHQCSIGQIEDCQQWDLVEQDGMFGVPSTKRPVQLYDVDELDGPESEWYAQIEEDLKDYHWMVRELDRLRDQLEDINAKMTRTYGVDGGQPKGKGRHGDDVQREVQRREKVRARLHQLEERVNRLDEASDRVEDERQRTLLTCMMEGQRMVWIAKHIGVSRQRLYDLKHELVRFLAVCVRDNRSRSVS